jgi:methionyl-tRNA formyltransferase
MAYRIVILTDATSWMLPYVTAMAERWRAKGHEVTVTHEQDYGAVDIAFFLSYSRLVKPEVLALARSNIVVHGSDLPKGRGWSPWTWQIIEGKNRLPLTLFEAAEGVDSGRIYGQRWVDLEGHELSPEWQALQASATADLCSEFVDHFEAAVAIGRDQVGAPTHYPRRRPEDSRIDPHLSIAEQFNLLRVVDNERYPAYFELEGQTYILSITKRRE